MSLFSRRDQTFHRSVSLVAFALLTGATLLVVTLFNREERDALRSEAAVFATGFSGSIESSSRLYITSVEHMASRLQLTGGLEPDLWRNDARNYIRDVSGFSQFTYIDTDLVIRAVEPIGQARDLTNLDITFDEDFVAFLQSVREAGRALVSPAYISATANRLNVAVFAPVTVGNDLRGYVGGEVDIGEFVESRYAAVQPELQIRVTQGGMDVFASSGFDGTDKRQDLKSVEFKIGNILFDLEYVPTVTVRSEMESGTGNVILVAGLMLAFFGALLVNQASKSIANRAKIREMDATLEQQAAALSFTHDAVFVQSADAEILYCNDAAVRLFGYGNDELKGMRADRLLRLPGQVAEDVAAWRDAKASAIDERRDQLVCRRKDGTQFDAELVTFPIADDAGGVAGIVSIVEDISERLENYRTLEVSERRLRAVFEGGHDGKVIGRIDDERIIAIDDANHAFEDLSGYTREQCRRADWRIWLRGRDQQEKIGRAIVQLKERGYSDEYTINFRRRSGERKLASIRFSVIGAADDGTQQVMAAVRDITELQKINARLEEAQNIAQIGYWSSGESAKRISVSDQFLKIYEIESDDGFVDGAVLQRRTHPDDLDKLDIRGRDRISTGDGVYTFVYRIVMDDGRIKYLRAFNRYDGETENGERRIQGTVQDITDHQLASLRLEEAQTIAKIGHWNFDTAKHEFYWSNSMYGLFGVSSDTMPLTHEELCEMMPADQQEAFRDTLAKHYNETYQSDLIAEMNLGGESKFFRFITYSNHIPAGVGSAKVFQLRGVVQDITDQRELEAQLHHGERLQALGQLTGGIAHDFKNILGIITSSVELMQMESVDNQEIEEGCQRVLRSVERGSSLTDQLLTFARKQNLRPQVIDCTEFVHRSADLFRRSLGDNIVVQENVRADVWCVRVDPSQLDNAILNLAINARDAMPGGGCVTISAENVDYRGHGEEAHPKGLAEGKYVAFTVGDTGTGIQKEIIHKVTEPFFTTKDQGQGGNGLGLSTVYGFAQQSGGALSISSEVGCGARVTIYLPADTSARDVSGPDSGAGKIQLPDTAATVLVVEDEPDLLHTISRMLGQLGYAVIPAQSADEALTAIQNVSSVDAALLDISLPGNKTGIDIAKAIKSRFPRGRIIFTSGYVPETSKASLSQFDHDGFLEKPVQIRQLSEKLQSLRGGAAALH